MNQKNFVMVSVLCGIIIPTPSYVKYQCLEKLSFLKLQLRFLGQAAILTTISCKNFFPKLNNVWLICYGRSLMQIYIFQKHSVKAAFVI